MHLASLCAPTLRWSAALLLLAVVAVDAQAQHARVAPSHAVEAFTPDTHFRADDGSTQAGVRCAVPTPSDAELRGVVAETEAFIARNGLPQAESGTVTIPVAVHVVRSGDAISQGNIPDQWIEDQIDVLNEAFDGTTGGYNTTFRFVLDQVTRTTNATWFSGCYSNPTPMKQALAVDPATTLNFYTCAPSGGILGFAVFPNSYPENSYNHGVVVHYNTLPGGSFVPYHLGDTGTHEVGHYLGLYHTFQGGCTGGDTPPGCQTGGDLVCDTAAEASPAFGCPAGRNTCGTGGPDPIENFMDYVDDSCMFEFTEGQSVRADLMMATYRPTIWATKGGGGTCEQELTATLSDDTPTQGQVITFDVTVTNNAATPATLDLWLDATGPANQRIRFYSGTLPAGATASAPFRVRIPGAAPSGSYTLDLNIGDYAANEPCDTVSFNVNVSEPRVGGDASDTEFEVEVGGDFFPTAAAVATPAVSVAPNPFARETSIRYEVAEGTDVRLAVYDVLGREVAVLADGYAEAGTYAATFDARGLAAGTYLYRLVIGNDVQTGRMTLAF